MAGGSLGAVVFALFGAVALGKTWMRTFLTYGRSCCVCACCWHLAGEVPGMGLCLAGELPWWLMCFSASWLGVMQRYLRQLTHTCTPPRLAMRCNVAHPGNSSSPERFVGQNTLNGSGGWHTCKPCIGFHSRAARLVIPNKQHIAVNSRVFHPALRFALAARGLFAPRAPEQRYTHPCKNTRSSSTLTAAKSTK